jgi:hypothetical protein
MNMATTAALGLAMSLATVTADAQPANSCFYMRDFQNWKAPDAKTIYIRVNVNRFYRLDLTGMCATLTWPGAHLITKTRGTDSVCQPIDWDLAVSDATGHGMGGMAEHCIVKTMTPLTPDQVAAIPPKFKP